ncbi:hypothetical protein JQ596_30630 [Bradyrhizobium manausense]|uniref:hypothetical protein n=1 Tax=Bradyrhizobium manausense TaxID=989370 RepID=UPI001BABCFE9|nr:hypothetical protein [Bradyrhizobium manausense]MBR0829894.1 hypothetical protein [Bradyrhizobium manausense]
MQLPEVERIIPALAHLKRTIFMKLHVLAPIVAFCACSSLMPGTASSAELSIPSSQRSASGYVYWDDVYPPAVYGPYLRSVEEVRALKANRQPVNARWNGYFYIR